VAGEARGRWATDGTVEGRDHARTGGHQLLGEAGRLGTSRLELRRSAKKKGGGRTGELTMEKGGRVAQGFSPKEKGGGAAATVQKSSDGSDDGGAWKRPRRGSRRFLSLPEQRRPYPKRTT
jgi:hypothetical protein